MANNAVKTEPDIIEIVNTAPLTRWYLRVVELNKKIISSPQEAIEILNELRIIKGKIIGGSLLEKSIKNLGVNNTNDINQAIENLTEEKESNKTSVVDEGKIKELVAEYEQYIENGLSEKEALNRIEKENEGNISAKEIENFIQRQSEIYQTKIKEIGKYFVPDKEEDKEDEEIENENDDDLAEEFINRKKIEIENKLKEEEKKEIILDKKRVIDLNNYEKQDLKNRDKIIEDKSDEVAQKIITELSSNERFEKLIDRERTKIKNELKESVKKVFSGEETTLGNGIIKVIQERDDSFIKQKIPINDSSIKAIQLELNNWINTNKKQVIEYRGKVLEKKIETEILKNNPELTKEEKVDVENYAKFVRDFYCSTTIVDLNENKEEAINYAESVGLSPGQVSNGWNNLEAFTGLINNTQKPLELIKQYKGLIEKIGNKIPTEIKECDSLNIIIQLAEKSQEFRKLIEKTQNILNWKGNLFLSIASKLGLEKFVTNVAIKVLGEEFVKNSLIILSQGSLKQGSLMILQSFIGGGIPALSVTAATITAQLAQETLLIAQTALTGAETLLAGATTVGEIATATANVVKATEALKLASEIAIKAGTALTNTTAAVGGTAAAAGTAAVAGTGVGLPVALIMAAIQVASFLKKQFGKIAEKLGISIKSFLERNFGKVGGSIIKGAILILGLPTLILTITVGPIILIFSLFFGGVLGYQQFNIVNLISTMNQPKGDNIVDASVDIKDDTPIEDPIDVPTDDIVEPWDETTCINNNYPTTVNFVNRNGQDFYIFEPNNRYPSGHMKQLYDIGCIESGIYMVNVGTAYSNGGNQSLDKRVLDAFYRLYNAGQTASLGKNELKLTSGYRSNQEQAEIRQVWKDKIKIVFEQGKCSDANWSCEALCLPEKDYMSLIDKIEKCTTQYAALPGTSNHLTGRAVDLKVSGGFGSETYNWLENNAAKYGFVYNYNKEAWHWEYNPAP